MDPVPNRTSCALCGKTGMEKRFTGKIGAVCIDCVDLCLDILQNEKATAGEQPLPPAKERPKEELSWPCELEAFDPSAEKSTRAPFGFAQRREAGGRIILLRDTCVICARKKEKVSKLIVGLHGAVCLDCIVRARDIAGIEVAPSRSKARLNTARQEHFCFMCGRSESEVPRLLEGVFGKICSDCVGACSEKLKELDSESEKKEET